MAYTCDPRRNANVDFYLAEGFDAHISPEIMHFITARAGKSVLDLGCGIGGNALRLKQLGFDVIAVDRNLEYIARAKTLGVDARHISGERLPFDDNSFDTVILVEVIEHLPDESIPEVLAEAFRVTRQNILITVPDCTQTQLLRKHGLLQEHFLTLDHVQFFDRKSLSTLLKCYSSGVDIIQGASIYPHRLLPPLVRRPISLLYRLGLLCTEIHGRLFAEAKKNA